MEKQEKVVLTLDSYEHGIMIRALNELRNDMLEEQRDPGPVEDVLLKTIDGRPLALCPGAGPGDLVRPADCACHFRGTFGDRQRPACGNEQSIQNRVV